MNSISKHYRWELLALLSCAFFFHQFDRAIFGSLLTQIRSDLFLSGKQVGVVSSTLFLVLALMIPIAGFASDRLSRKKIIVFSLIVGGIGTFFTGIAGGVAGLIVFRSILMGGAGALYAPAAYPMIAQYHHETRSTALAVHQSALYFSLMSSGFFAVGFSSRLGWRGTFLLLGILGILLACLLAFRIRNDKSNAVSESPNGGKSTESPLKSTLRFFKNRNVLLLTLGYTSIVFVNNSYVVWAPSFVESKFGLPLIQAAGYTMLYHHLAAFFGIVSGGILTDRFVRRFTRFRLVLQFSALLLGVPGIVLFGMGNCLTAIWYAAAWFGFFRGVYEANTHAAVFDYVRAEHRGTTVGLMTMTAYLIGAFSPLLLGWSVSRYGEASGLSYGFTTLASAYLFGAIGVFIAWRLSKKRRSFGN